MHLALVQGELRKALFTLGHRRQHLGRRGLGRVLDLRQLGVQRLAVFGDAVALIEQSGQRGDLLQQLGGPFLHAHRLAVALQLQARTATFLDHAEEVGRGVAALVAGEQRAVVQRAVQQERVEEARLRQVDAHRQERVDVQAAHFDVLDATGHQRLDRSLAGVGHTFRADVGVVLVFDLQDVGVELHPLTVLVRADFDVRRVGRCHRFTQAVGVAVQVVVARREAGLGIALVTQVAHAQAGGVRQVQGVGVQDFELVRATAQEAGVQGRRRTKQVHQQPAVAAEIADQGDVGRGLVIAVGADKSFSLLEQRPQLFRQGEVVVDAGDALHGLAVTQGQALAINVLELPDIGRAVVGNRNVFLGRQRARHRGAPQVFAAELGVGKAMDLVQAAQGIGRVWQGGSDELQQRFRVVGGDLFVGQRGAQGFGVRRLCQAAFAGDAQAFALDAVQALL